jgi:BirA family biotin operon repressor/biotin-[acetyl-CoA-carboxylase] ligase
VDWLSPDLVEPLLRGRLGRPYLYEPVTESTQLMLGPSLPDGAVAACEEQKAGRGRLGRHWEAPHGSSILCSVLLKPAQGRRLAEISLVGGVAAADALEAALGLAVQIKWPNDVMVNRHKVAGVLAEARDGIVVLGIGINVNQSRDQLPSRSASLRTVTGQEWRRAPLLASLLVDLERAYSEWLVGGLDAVYPRLGARDFLRGRRVTVDGTAGVAELIDRDGRLAVRTDDGRHLAVESGDVQYEL